MNDRENDLRMRRLLRLHRLPAHHVEWSSTSTVFSDDAPPWDYGAAIMGVWLSMPGDYWDVVSRLRVR